MTSLSEDQIVNFSVDCILVYCYSARPGPRTNDCNAKDGKPFGSFWDNFGVDFGTSEFYEPLSPDRSAEAWNARFPPKQNPVLAFVGAPASFPARSEHLQLHRFLRWSASMETRLQTFVQSQLDNGRYVALHLRNGPDFVS